MVDNMNQVFPLQKKQQQQQKRKDNNPRNVHVVILFQSLFFIGQELKVDGCPMGFVPTPCPSDIPGCIAVSLLCDLAWDCSSGEDESASLFSCPSEFPLKIIFLN